MHMKGKIFVLTTLYFFMHLLFVYGINAEELVSPKNMEMAQKDQQSIADKEKLL